MKIVFSEKCLEYYEPLMIESPDRVLEAYGILREIGYAFVRPQPASYNDLLKVHSKEHIETIRSGDFYDADTPAYENIYDYACLAAGGAIMAAKLSAKKANLNGFSMMRPPGHHAGVNGPALGANTLGFCYFNNIAVAVRSLNVPTLIIDIDGHHGNGTQEIFLGDESVTFVSLHSVNIYPGTGLESEENCLNHAFYEPPGDRLYLRTLKKLLSQVNTKDIKMISISAGFDAHAGDLSSLGLTSACYRKIGEIVKLLKKPVFCVLEGGYVGKNVGMGIHNLIKGLEL